MRQYGRPAGASCAAQFHAGVPATTAGHEPGVAPGSPAPVGRVSGSRWLNAGRAREHHRGGRKVSPAGSQ